jgi:Flp pilus assembly CpaE family ATPase
LSPPAIEMGELITASNIRSMLESLTKAFKLTIVDTGPQLTDKHIDIYARSDLVIDIVNQDIQSLKACGRIMSIFSKMEFTDEKHAILINRYSPHRQPLDEKIAESFGGSVLGCFPALGNAEMTALTREPVALRNLHPRTQRALSTIASSICQRLSIGYPSEAISEKRASWRRY